MFVAMYIQDIRRKKEKIVTCKFVTSKTDHDYNTTRTNTRVHTSNIRVQKTKYGTGYIRIQWLHTNDTNT